MEEARLFDLPAAVGVHNPNPCVLQFGLGPEGEHCRSCALLVKRDTIIRTRQRCKLRKMGRYNPDEHRAGFDACRMYLGVE